MALLVELWVEFGIKECFNWRLDDNLIDEWIFEIINVSLKSKQQKIDDFRKKLLMACHSAEIHIENVNDLSLTRAMVRIKLIFITFLYAVSCSKDYPFACIEKCMRNVYVLKTMPNCYATAKRDTFNNTTKTRQFY